MSVSEPSHAAGNPAHAAHGRPAGIWQLAICSLGIVFGDIGTSPLYTLKECLHVASTHGEAFAAWIHDKPLAKLAVRTVMDTILAFRGAELAERWGIDTEVAVPNATPLR